MDAIYNGLIYEVTGVEGGGVDLSYIGRMMLILLGMYVISTISPFFKDFIA